MKVTLESTDRLISVNGVPGRIWQGDTDSGIPVVALISLVGVRNGNPTEQFEKELREHVRPNKDAVEAFDPRTIL